MYFKRTIIIGLFSFYAFLLIMIIRRKLNCVFVIDYVLLFMCYYCHDIGNFILNNFINNIKYYIYIEYINKENIFI